VKAAGAGNTQAAEYARRAALAGITWPVLDDAELSTGRFRSAMAARACVLGSTGLRSNASGSGAG
jgi:hypothetical protein